MGFEMPSSNEGEEVGRVRMETLAIWLIFQEARFLDVASNWVFMKGIFASFFLFSFFFQTTTIVRKLANVDPFFL